MGSTTPNSLMSPSFKLYGQHLLLCRFLVGRQYNEGRDIAGTGYNSKFMAMDKDGKAQMIVTDKEDQIFFIFLQTR